MNSTTIACIGTLALITGCASDSAFTDSAFTTQKVILQITDTGIYNGFGISPGQHLSVRTRFRASSLPGMAKVDKTRAMYIMFETGGDAGISRTVAVSNELKNDSPNVVSISVSSYDKQDALYSRTSGNDFPSIERVRLLSSYPCGDLTYTAFAASGGALNLGTIHVAAKRRSAGAPCLDLASVPTPYR